MALARRQMKAKGPAGEDPQLVPPTKPIFPRHRAPLQEDGREALLEAATCEAGFALDQNPLRGSRTSISTRARPG